VTSRDGSTASSPSPRSGINSREMHFQASSSSLSSESHMTSRAFCVPGVVFLFAATVLLLITSISLPYLPVVDFARANVRSGNIGVADAQGNVTSPLISQLKVSRLVGGACWIIPNGRLRSSDCGLTAPSSPPLGIATAAPLDTLTPSAFETTALATRSLSGLAGLEAWRSTPLVRHRKFISHGSSTGL